MLAPKFNKRDGLVDAQRVTELEAENMALRQQVAAATTPRARRSARRSRPTVRAAAGEHAAHVGKMRDALRAASAHADAAALGEAAPTVASIRGALLAQCEGEASAQAALEQLVPRLAATSRAAYLVSPPR